LTGQRIAKANLGAAVLWVLLIEASAATTIFEFSKA